MTEFVPANRDSDFRQGASRRCCIPVLSRKLGNGNYCANSPFTTIWWQAFFGRSYPYRAAPVIGFFQARNGEWLAGNRPTCFP